MSDYQQTIEFAKNKARKLSNSYHNQTHIENVVDAAERIGEKEGLSQDGQELLLIAAWYHDIGHANGADGHEERSAELAEEKMRENGYPDSDAELVGHAIRATELPQNPVNKLGEILCDADLSNIGQDNFFEQSLKVRDEVAPGLSDEEWLAENAKEILQNQEWFTSAARSLFESKRKQNLKELESRVNG